MFENPSFGSTYPQAVILTYTVIEMQKSKRNENAYVEKYSVAI